MNHRIYITTADIQQLTGKSAAASRRILRVVKDSYHQKDSKHKFEFITFQQYCEETGTPLKELKQALELE